MLIEHQELIDYIEKYIIDTKYYGRGSIIYKINYIEEEFTGIQVHITNNVSQKDNIQNLQKIIKEEYSEIVSFIYTIQEDSLFVIYLKPIEELRSKKISIIKSKINGI